jgi:hypothetical protein
MCEEMSITRPCAICGTVGHHDFRVGLGYTCERCKGSGLDLVMEFIAHQKAREQEYQKRSRLAKWWYRFTSVISRSSRYETANPLESWLKRVATMDRDSLLDEMRKATNPAVRLAAILAPAAWFSQTTRAQTTDEHLTLEQMAINIQCWELNLRLGPLPSRKLLDLILVMRTNKNPDVQLAGNLSWAIGNRWGFFVQTPRGVGAGECMIWNRKTGGWQID